MSKPSASGLWRACMCPASCVLPPPKHENRSDNAMAAANRGTRIHTFLEKRGKCEPSPEDTTTCMGIDIDAVAPPGLCEAAFAYDVLSHKVRLIGFSRNRDYGEVAETEICGTADLIQGVATGGKEKGYLIRYPSEPRGTGWEPEEKPSVRDWKTGRTPVAHPSRNMQLHFLGLCVHKWTGAKEVDVDICYIRTKGDHKIVGPYTMREAGFEILEARLEQNFKERIAAEEMLRRGFGTKSSAVQSFLAAGKQCQWCEHKDRSTKKCAWLPDEGREGS